MAAVVNLWPSGDPADVVTFESATVTPEPLSSYVATATIRPLRGAGSNVVVPWFGLVQDLDAGTSAAPAQNTGSQQDSPSEPSQPETPPPSATPTPSSTAAATSSSEDDETPSSTTEGTPSPTGDSAQSSTTTSAPQPVPPGDLHPLDSPDILDVPPSEWGSINCAVQEQPALDDYALPGCTGSEPPVSQDPAQQAGSGHGEINFLYDMAPGAAEATVDAEGKPIAPEDAAKEIAARLQNVRTQPTASGTSRGDTSGAPAQLDPLGERATVNMNIQGLRSQHLYLFWRLTPLDSATTLPVEWERPTPACIITPGSDLDSVSIDVWVPLPVTPGPFVLDFMVAREPANTTLASRLTDQFS